jgi:hypothetical protein
VCAGMPHVGWIGCGRALQLKKEQGMANWDGGEERVLLMLVSETGRERDQQRRSSLDEGRWGDSRKR